jgi:hypothetical protein
MRLSNMKVVPRPVTDQPGRECVDRVTVVVMVVFIAFVLVRGVIPALIDGERLGVALLAAGLGLVGLAISLLPAWRQRRHRSAGRLTSPP